MRWERLFDDLEDQMASETEAERSALDTEAERLRLSRVTLRERLARSVGRVGSFDLADGSMHSARVSAVGADWVALEPAEGRADGLLVPLASIATVDLRPDPPHPATSPPATTSRPERSCAEPSALLDRMTFGYVVRDLVRRRSSVAIHLVSGRVLAGTIDRAGVDHLDIALHEQGSPRRSDAVTGHRLVTFATIAWIRIGAPIVR